MVLDRIEGGYLACALLLVVTPTDETQCVAGVIIGALLSGFAITHLPIQKAEDECKCEKDIRKSLRHRQALHGAIACIFGPSLTWWVYRNWLSREEYPVFSTSLICSGLVGLIGVGVLRGLLPRITRRVVKVVSTAFGIDKESKDDK